MNDEDRIRADERMKVLREVRKEAAQMNNEPSRDPYLWGYGGSKIVGYLSSLVAEQRELVASLPPVEPEPDWSQCPACCGMCHD